MTNEEMFNKLERGISNLTPQCQLKFEVHIVEHCNLNCKQCAHFSPLAQESYIDVDAYARDINRLSELFEGGGMSSILLLGGEPLLHPQLIEIMGITRKAFPVGRIRIVTNGILLPKMTDEFWEKCREFDVEISPSEYPIKFDYNAWADEVEKKNVRYSPYSFARKTMYKIYPICSKREGVYGLSRSNFFHCTDANHCVTLRDGRMYTCDIAAHAIHLKKYFNLDIQLSKRNGVDIYAVKSGDDLLEKLAKPIPFCQYCDVVDEGRLIECDWAVSRKDRYEWLAFEFTEDDFGYLKSKQPDVYVFGAGEWGHRTVYALQKQGIPVKAVFVTRNSDGFKDVYGVPIVLLNQAENISKESICLVAMHSHIMKAEVYPLLSKMGFGDVVPVFGLE